MAKLRRTTTRRRGHPLPAGSIDMVISECMIALSVDESAVLIARTACWPAGRRT
jgi:hypothetical protein